MIKKFLLVFIVFIMIESCVNAKYIFQYELDVADLDIDRTKPVIELISISNTNKGYENYANKTHNITLKVKVIEKNMGTDTIENVETIIKVNGQELEDYKISINMIEKNEKEAIFDINLTNLTSNGILEVKFIEGTIIDKGGLKSDEKLINTKITIDNIAPSGNLVQEKIDDGKIKGVVQLDEPIRDVEGWNLSEDRQILTNEFSNNLYYKLQVIDYAQNSSEIEIDISEATNILVTYASHNSEYGWSFGHSNYDIAGKEAFRKNSRYKTEALAFSYKGNVSSDFIQVRAYNYNYWGEGNAGICDLSGNKYIFGYNPSNNLWYTMNSDNLITINNDKYIELGGSGVNTIGHNDWKGNNPVPEENRGNYFYGISSINMKLKDESYFSIVYQILVDGVGWIEPKSDGNECVYRKNKPFSAFRMALIPKKEKQHLVNMWQKDVGTYNI